MARSTLAAIAFGAALWAFAALGMVGEPLVRAAIAVGVAIAATSFAYGQASFVAVGVGALSPLAFSLLQKHSIGLAASTLCLLWLLPRLVLAESQRRLVVLAALSAAAALVAGFIFAAYLGAPWAAQAASCLFAGSCLSLVVLVPVDTGMSFALRSAAAVIGGAPRETLERAADAHRRFPWRGQKSKQWRALLRLADERAALERSNGGPSDGARLELDLRIAELAEELAPLAKPIVAAPISTGSLNEPPGAEVSSETNAQGPADMAAE